MCFFTCRLRSAVVSRFAASSFLRRPFASSRRSLFVSVVPLDIPLSHAFGYADPIVHFNRVCRATLLPPGSRFSHGWSLWPNPSFNRTCARSRAGRLIQTLGHISLRSFCRNLERPYLLLPRLVISTVPVFLGSQADVLFHLPSPLSRRLKVCCLILSSSAFRVIALVTFPLRGAAGYSVVSRLQLC